MSLPIPKKSSAKKSETDGDAQTMHEVRADRKREAAWIPTPVVGIPVDDGRFDPLSPGHPRLPSTCLSSVASSGEPPQKTMRHSSYGQEERTNLIESIKTLLEQYMDAEMEKMAENTARLLKTTVEGLRQKHQKELRERQDGAKEEIKKLKAEKLQLEQLNAQEYQENFRLKEKLQKIEKQTEAMVAQIKQKETEKAWIDIYKKDALVDCQKNLEKLKNSFDKLANNCKK